MIRILDKKVADKIAAGEVVERPVSIIKELVENSIDAKSDKITIEIKNGGKSYIRVSDNGIGIEKSDINLAFLRHATSKIETEEDLDSILTLGFRGEALASIAAVSKVELVTKASSEIIWGGETLETTSFGAPQGTTIVIKDLFFNTPARLKFLKADRTEASIIIDFVTSIAIAYPNIKIMLINNGKILFSTNGKGRVIDAIRTISGGIEADKLIELSYDDNIKVSGYVSPPALSRASRREQLFFVNGRIVNSKVIEKAISKAYSDRLFEGRHPICYIFLEIDPLKLDVNIHPNKKEVKFHDDDVIIDNVNRAIVNALNSEKGLTLVEKNSFKTSNQHSFDDNSSIDKNGLENKNYHDTTLDLNHLNKNSSDNRLNENSDSSIDIEATNTTNKEASSIEFLSDLDILKNFSKIKEEEVVSIQKETEVQDDIFNKNEEMSSTIFDFSKLTIVNQVFGTYIQLMDFDSIYFVDQHAAHERVFFEKFLKDYENSSISRQITFNPFIISVSYKQKELESIWMKIIERCGFTIEEFGPKEYRVTEIPILFGLSEAENFLKDFFDTFDDKGAFDDKKLLDRIATKACKAAIKGNNSLDIQEIKTLLSSMEKCNNPYSCPHGRPTFIKIEKKEIEKRFKRI